MTKLIDELIKAVPGFKCCSSTDTFETSKKDLFDFAELIIKEGSARIMTLDVCSSFEQYDDLGDYDKGVSDAVSLASSRIRGMLYE